MKNGSREFGTGSSARSGNKLIIVRKRAGITFFLKSSRHELKSTVKLPQTIVAYYYILKVFKRDENVSLHFEKRVKGQL